MDNSPYSQTLASTKLIIYQTILGAPIDFVLKDALTTLGRQSNNSIHIPTSTVSRYHARIERTQDSHTITDLVSTNGTFLNGTQLTPNVPHVLNAGDVIYLGEEENDAPRLIYVTPTSIALDNISGMGLAARELEREIKIVNKPIYGNQPETPPSALRLSQSNASPSEKPQPFVDSFAVVIGIDEYKNGIPCLKTAVNDARRFAQVLKKDYQYKVDLLVEDVTLSKLKQFLTETLPEKVSADDRVLFYFAGHGIAIDEDDGPNGYLVPQDSLPEDHNSFLPMNLLHDSLMALPCRHMLIILDCCFAGAIRWSTMRDIIVKPLIIHRERYERFIQDPAWQVITSSAYDEKALDILDNEVLGERGDGIGNHSPFAQALFEALSGKADIFPDGKGNGIITASELYLYLRNYVEVDTELNAHRQTPGLWPLKKHDKGEFIFRVPHKVLDLPPAPELSYDNNPYRGLQAYEEEHAELFFGRETVTEKLVKHVETNNLTIVLGASGIGKSSLVKAGLLPNLGGVGQADIREDGSQVESNWYILSPIRPTEAPIDTFATLIKKELPLPPTFQMRANATNEETIILSLRAWYQNKPSQKLLLIIDQLEELITLCYETEERERFIQLLVWIIRTLKDRVHLVLTLRSDFEPQLAELALKPYWHIGRFMVPPLTQAELREVIEGPASERVLYFEPSSMVDLLINEVIQTPGALPLLSFTLSEMYIKYLQRRSDNRAMNEIDYQALGGVIGALRYRANTEYNDLDVDYQATMRRIILRMVVSEGGELARRRVFRDELVFTSKEENDRVEHVLQHLIQARLLVTEQSEDGQPYIEPAHDALVRAWDKLLIWLQEAEDYLPIQRRLTQSVADWKKETDVNVKQDLLWHDDPRLPQIEASILNRQQVNGIGQQILFRLKELGPAKPIQLIAEHWLNRDEFTFVKASIEQRRKEARRTARIIGGAFIVLLILTIVAISASINLNEANLNLENQIEIRTTAEANAIAERNIAFSRQLASQSLLNLDENLDTALLLSVQASKIVNTFESQNSLLSALLRNERQATFLHGHQNSIASLDVSSDGKLIASASCVTSFCNQGKIVIWQVGATHIQNHNTFIGHEGFIFDLEFSQDNSILASAGQDQKIILWDVERHQPIGTPLFNQTGPVTSLAFSPNRKILASVDTEGAVVLWNVEDTQLITTRNLTSEDSIFNDSNDIVFNSDGSLLAAARDRTITIWSLKENEILHQISILQGQFTQITFSPDGQILASINCINSARGCSAHELSFWSMVNGEEVQESLAKIDNWLINDIAFSHDGNIFATSGCKNESLPPNRTCSSGEINLWDTRFSLPSFLQKEVFDLHSGTINNLEFFPNDNILIAGGDDGKISFWNLQNYSLQTLLSGPELNVRFGRGDITFSPDGNLIASVDRNGAIWLWDANTYEQIGEPITAHQETGLEISFSEDSKSLASVSFNELIILDLLRGSVNRINVGNDEAFLSVAMSSDGRYLAAGSCIAHDGEGICIDGGIHLWDMRIPDSEPTILLGHDLAVLSVDFNPKGNILASGSTDGTVMFWNVDTTEPLYSRIQVDDLGVRSIKFGPSGEDIAVGGNSGIITLWHVRSGQMIRQPFVGHTQPITDIDYSADGERMASTSFESSCDFCLTGETYLWDVSSKTPIGILDRRNGFGVGFSPDGHTLAVAIEGKGGVLWNVDLEYWQDVGCELANRDLSQDEWESFVGENALTYNPCIKR